MTTRATCYASLKGRTVAAAAVLPVHLVSSCPNVPFSRIRASCIGGKMRASAAFTGLFGSLVLSAAVGCGSPPHSVVDHAPMASATATVGTEPRPGSPAFCAMLARSSALRALPGALTAIGERSPREGSVSTVRSAAADLSRVAPAVPTALRPDFGQVAAALTQMADRGLSSPRSLDRVGVSLTRLGQEVQGPCGFPVG